MDLNEQTVAKIINKLVPPQCAHDIEARSTGCHETNPPSPGMRTFVYGKVTMWFVAAPTRSDVL